MWNCSFFNAVAEVTISYLYLNTFVLDWEETMILINGLSKLDKQWVCYFYTKEILYRCI